jgi:hypothetical protein
LPVSVRAVEENHDEDQGDVVAAGRHHLRRPHRVGLLAVIAVAVVEPFRIRIRRLPAEPSRLQLRRDIPARPLPNPTEDSPNVDQGDVVNEPWCLDGRTRSGHGASYTFTCGKWLAPRGRGAGVLVEGLEAAVGEVEKVPSSRRQGRRRQANAEGGRPHRHEVLATEEQEARLRQLADEQRVTVPRLLVEAALAQQGETPTQRRDTMTELFRLQRLLAGVANNINQLARAANSTGELPEQLGVTMAALRRTSERIDDAIDRLARP